MNNDFLILIYLIMIILSLYSLIFIGFIYRTFYMLSSEFTNFNWMNMWGGNVSRCLFPWRFRKIWNLKKCRSIVETKRVWGDLISMEKKTKNKHIVARTHSRLFSILQFFGPISRAGSCEVFFYSVHKRKIVSCINSSPPRNMVGPVSLKPKNLYLFPMAS